MCDFLSTPKLLCTWVHYCTWLASSLYCTLVWSLFFGLWTCTGLSPSASFCTNKLNIQFIFKFHSYGLSTVFSFIFINSEIYWNKTNWIKKWWIVFQNISNVKKINTEAFCITFHPNYDLQLSKAYNAQDYFTRWNNWID